MAAAGGVGAGPGLIGAAYLAAEGYETALAGELSRAGVVLTGWHGRLALSPDPQRASAWALDVWTAPVEQPAPSVKAAADILRAVQRNWAGYHSAHHRRSALIQARLPPVRARPLTFPEPAPASHLGGWTLLAPDRLLFSPAKTSPFPNGEAAFVEDRVGPPSRAYLKLWEALTRLGIWPLPGESCVDLGAAPGGWTWALAQLGAQVLAIDRAPLTPTVAAMPGVRWQEGNAFAVAPFTVDWVFSDVIAYPDALLAMVRRWVQSGLAGRIVCTVKLQGETDHDATDTFAALPGGRLVHLHHNKHELTFFWQRDAIPR